MVSKKDINLKIYKMTDTMIYPELGQKTKATIEYKVSYSSGFYLTTDLDLKGRGIALLGDGTDHKRNKKTYRATEKALENLKKEFNTCYIASL